MQGFSDSFKVSVLNSDVTVETLMAMIAFCEILNNGVIIEETLL